MTNLSQSRHVNLGWIVHSHPEYVNQALATQDLKRRTNSTEVRFELLPHSLTHTTAEGTKITTKALKLRVEYDYRQELFNSLLTCFAKGNEDERLTSMSNTAEWKLIPFANNTLSRDQMTAMGKIKRSICTTYTPSRLFIWVPLRVNLTQRTYYKKFPRRKTMIPRK